MVAVMVRGHRHHLFSTRNLSLSLSLSLSVHRKYCTFSVLHSPSASIISTSIQPSGYGTGPFGLVWQASSAQSLSAIRVQCSSGFIDCVATPSIADMTFCFLPPEHNTHPHRRYIENGLLVAWAVLYWTRDGVETEIYYKKEEQRAHTVHRIICNGVFGAFSSGSFRC